MKCCDCRICPVSLSLWCDTKHDDSSYQTTKRRKDWEHPWTGYTPERHHLGRTLTSWLRWKIAYHHAKSPMREPANRLIKDDNTYTCSNSNECTDKEPLKEIEWALKTLPLTLRTRYMTHKLDHARNIHKYLLLSEEYSPAI